MVIPVDAANKRKIKGRVHDGSGSGKTVFIEPEAVAEANNRLRELEADERREVVENSYRIYRPYPPAFIRPFPFIQLYGRY